MASIQKRNGSYRVRVKRVGETTLSKTFTSRTDALQWAKFIEAQLTLSLHEDEKTPNNEAVLFKDAAESYIKNHSDLKIANPIKGIKRMSPSQGRSKRVHKLIEDPLLAACDALTFPILRSLIIFAVETGMRRNEIMGLSWGDVDLPNRKAYLHTSKNGEPRQVPLTQRVLEVLKALNRDESGKVFPMTVYDLRGQFSRAKAYAKERWADAGINPFDDLRFHDLRHEALSRLSDAGLNVIELSCISGHKTLGMLKRYTHPSHEAILHKIDSY